MQKPGIYKIQSKTKPERIYVGSAINCDYRWGGHLRELRHGKHHSSKLQNHYNKYGEDDLYFVIIEPCLPHFLIKREQFYIDELKPFFNVAKIAGSSLGICRTEEFKEKERKANTGIKRTIEHNLKISEAQMGEKNSFYKKTHTQETKDRIGAKSRQTWALRKSKEQNNAA